MTRLHIPFLFNKISASTKYIILLWIDNEKDLLELVRIKKETLIKIFAVPTAYQIKSADRYNELYALYIDTVDCHLMASDVESAICIKNIPADKLQIWPSGIKLGKKNKISVTQNCICYFKDIPVNEKLMRQIEELGIHCHLIQYRHYKFEDWKKMIEKVDLVIFFSEKQETQGLALYEAWTENKPTIIPKNMCPYFMDGLGLEYTTTDILMEILKKYANNPKNFLEQFSPYAITEQNFTDEISVKKLMHIIRKKSN